MKRSGFIKRKTPLKAFSQLKRTRLNHKSKDKLEYDKLYEEAKAAGSCHVSPEDQPFVILHKDECDPHHPFGRAKDKLLAFIWITKGHHRRIHDANNVALELGWIHPAFRGAQLDPAWPRPWNEAAEKSWPKKYQRPKFNTNGTNHQSNPPESL